MKSFSEQHYEPLGFITTGNYFSNQNKKSLLKEHCTMELLSLSVYHISSKSTNSERTHRPKSNRRHAKITCAQKFPSTSPILLNFLMLMHYNHLILVFFVHLKFKRANMAYMRNNEIMISNVNPEWETSCFTSILEQKACVSWCCLKSHARSTITRCDKPDNWPTLLTNIPTMQLLFRLAQLRTLRLTEEINVLLFYCRGTTFETR